VLPPAARAPPPPLLPLPLPLPLLSVTITRGLSLAVLCAAVLMVWPAVLMGRRALLSSPTLHAAVVHTV
jgi:hypothetical protein